MTKPIVLNRQQVRQVDRIAIDQYGISGLFLMENAGRGVVDTLQQLGIKGPVVICCGKGNNAGDGFVIARHLDLRGYETKVLLCADANQLQGDAAENYHILCKTPVKIISLDLTSGQQVFQNELVGADWIVDALLGTGSVGDPRPPLAGILNLLNQQPAKKMAVDLPSGLDCDTGRAATCTFRADHTCTFVAAKPGFFAPGAETYVGKLHLLDIGAPREIVQQVLKD